MWIYLISAYLFLAVMSVLTGPLAKSVKKELLRYKVKFSLNSTLNGGSRNYKRFELYARIYTYFVYALLFPVFYLALLIDRFRGGKGSR